LNALNPNLYLRLSQVFGEVGIVNQGAPGSVYTSKNILYDKRNPASREYTLHINDWGETYKVCCPKCGDSRNRLFISHLWNSRVENIDKPIRHVFVKCHNEDCPWYDLNEFLNDQALIPHQGFSLHTGKVNKTAREVMKSPGDTQVLSDLGATHPAVMYIEGYRHFDTHYLSKNWDVRYCFSSPWKTPVTWNSDSSFCCYRTPEDRIIFPMLDAYGQWLGWQARWIGSRQTDDVSLWDKVPREPGGGEKVPKYLTAPGLTKSSMVWNLDRAVKVTGGEYVVVSEGPMSMMATGLAGVCTLGTLPSNAQIEELGRALNPGGLVILFLEPEGANHPKLGQKIADIHRVGLKCYCHELPEDKDAADLGLLHCSELIDHILHGRDT